MLGKDRQHLREGDGAVADRAADEPISLVGELDTVVLEMHVTDLGRNHTGESEWRLGDWKRIPGVEDDADIRRRPAGRAVQGPEESRPSLPRALVRAPAPAVTG